MIVDRHAIATVFTLLTVAGCATSTAARVPDTNARETMMRKEFPALFRSADSALTGMPPTVMQKHKIPPSGNRHDYMSLAPYWWPDSSKADGLPYVRHDGLVNPESRIDHDGTRFQVMVDAVEALTLAHHLSGDRKYSARAETFLRVWFVDTATRMNPNLNYAQAVLGVNDGRGTGIIDTRDIPYLLKAVRLLAESGDWSGADNAALGELIARARAATTKPLFVKLSPTLQNIADTARHAVASGADGISVVNTLPGLAIDVEQRAPVLGFGTGGVSGAGLLPVGVLATFRVAKAVSVPVIGVGGISSATDIVQYMMAGASLVAVGTAIMRDPRVAPRLVAELDEWCAGHGVGNVSELRGALAWQ